MSFQDLATSNQAAASSTPSSSLSLQIFKLNANVRGIRSLAEQIGTPRDSSSLRARLRDLTETTRALVQRASTEMQALAAQAPQGPALRKLVSDLDVSVRNFQAAQKFSATRQRANVFPAHVSHVPLVDISESPNQVQTQVETQMQTQMQIVYATEEAFRDAEILERRAAIREIEEGMAGVAQIVRNLSELVELQGGDIVTLDWNVQRTARDLERGADELQTAARNQRRARRTCLTIILGVVCVVVILAVLI
ncbi:t-SNARE [Mycena leptocephala]|nr:t-SNARE [Mycena leptocephala]